jgi:tRNA threonylcarbamoyladenosine biosynthesis protein TsaB
LVRLKPGIVVGPGAGLFEGLAGARIAPLPAPDPAAMARLAARAGASERPPRPIYLRAPDARPSA